MPPFLKVTGLSVGRKTRDSLHVQCLCGEKTYQSYQIIERETVFPLVQSRWHSLSTLNKNAEKSIRKSYAPIAVKPQVRGRVLSWPQEIVLFQKISILPSRRVFGV